MTERQKRLMDHLLRQLGFSNDDFLDKYLRYITMNFQRLSSLIKPKEGGEASFIDYLNSEIRIRRDLDFKTKQYRGDYITGTDISNYTYCPISFAIGKTFEVDKKESTLIGESQHDQCRLINYLRPFKKIVSYFNEISYQEVEVEDQLSFDRFIGDSNSFFFEGLRNSEIIFCGHQDNKGEYFSGDKRNYVGQPDYIFFDKSRSGFYVVEEKFQYDKEAQKAFKDSYYGDYHSAINSTIDWFRDESINESFFENHLNQLRSYIYGIRDYNLNYGFLVYWKYIVLSGEPKIVGCKVFKLVKSPTEKKIISDVVVQMLKLLKAGEGAFEINGRSPEKCAGCVQNQLCGHKTGRYNRFTIPYSKDYLRLVKSSF